MPRKLPPEHSRFKKGQSGNPGGRPKVPDELKKIREMRPWEVKLVIAKYLRMTRAETQFAMTDPQISMMELNIAAGLAIGAKNGDLSKLGYLLERVLGKPNAEEEPLFAHENPADLIPTEKLLEVLKT